MDLLLGARRIAGERGALPLVLLRLARGRPEDARARAAVREVLGDRADPIGRGDGPPRGTTPA
jgi:hypothetical protein